MSIEHDLNCAILKAEDYSDIAELGVKPEFFSDTVERNVFELIEEHMLEHRKVPGIDAVRHAYPNYAFIDTEEPVKYYALKVKDAHVYRLVMDGLTAMMQRIEDPATTGQELKIDLDEISYRANLGAAMGSMVDFYPSHPLFFNYEYPIRQKQGYLRGISTGFGDLDKVTGGYQPGQLIVLFGLAKHGKSTMMLSSASTAKRQYYNPLFVTFEMAISDMRWRSISLQAGVSLTKLLNGELPPPDVEHVYRVLRQQEGIHGFTMVEDTNSMYTLGAVNQKIIEINPDVVFIDGFYWMDAPGEPKSNESITYLTRGLKQLAQNHKIPIVVSTQALPSRSKGGLHAGSVGYSQTLQQDADILIGVYKKTDTLSDFSVLHNRNGPTANCFIRIDWDHGLIEQEDYSVAMAEIESSGSSASPGGTWSPP